MHIIKVTKLGKTQLVDTVRTTLAHHTLRTKTRTVRGMIDARRRTDTIKELAAMFASIAIVAALVVIATA